VLSKFGPEVFELTAVIPAIDDNPALRDLLVSLTGRAPAIAAILCYSGEIKSDLKEFCDEKNILLLHHAERLDFSDNINRGLLEVKTAWVWCLNADMALAEDALKKAIEAIAQSKERDFAISPASYFKSWQGPVETITSIAERQGRKVALNVDLLLKQLSWPEGLPLIWASGGSGIFNFEKLKELGLFSESYQPMYGEDLDLGLKAWSRAWRISYAPSIKLLHQQGDSAKRIFNEKEIKIMAECNLRLALWQYMSPEQQAQDSRLTFYHALFRFFTGNGIYLKAWRRAKNLFAPPELSKTEIENIEEALEFCHAELVIAAAPRKEILRAWGIQ